MRQYFLPLSRENDDQEFDINEDEVSRVYDQVHNQIPGSCRANHIPTTLVKRSAFFKIGLLQVKQPGFL